MITKLTPQEKADRGMFMNIFELAEVVGIERHRMARIVKQPGFPIFEGKVMHADFLTWYRRVVGISQPHPVVVDHPLPTADKSDVPLRSRGSRQVALRARGRRF